MAATVPATADATEPFPESTPYLSLQLGGMGSLGTWDLSDVDTNRAVMPDSGMRSELGGQIGWQFSPRLSAEGGLAFVGVPTDNDERSTVLSYEVDALYHLTDKEIAPYLLGGVGGYHAASGELASDFDPYLHAGVGVRAMMWPRVALRGELRASTTDSIGGGGANLGLRIGVDLFARAGGPPDTDQDGISDDVDVCPQTPGAESAQGCPDADGDSIADSTDRCPQLAGDAATQGCPDPDGDGFVGSDDECPQDAGVAALKGCPDSDEDGIADAADTCPQEPGPEATGGCPDTDRDGIADKDDKCPEIRGLKSHDGCVPEEVQRFTGAIEGIYFNSGSAVIQSRSHGILDTTTGILNTYPDLRLRIVGHTDDQGAAEYNMQLSKDRAAAVAAYMVAQGVDASRLQSEGYGESKPIADNGTASGRAKNRRIEFSIIEQ